MTTDALTALADAMRQAPVLTPEPGDYATLLDEHDPEGDVVVYRADGTPVAQMARALWDTLREDAGNAGPPVWTRAMGNAVLQRLLTIGEARTPSWPQWRLVRRAIASPERLYEIDPGSSHSLILWCIENLEMVPRELLPYLPCYHESTIAPGYSTYNEGLAR